MRVNGAEQEASPFLEYFVSDKAEPHLPVCIFRVQNEEDSALEHDV